MHNVPEWVKVDITQVVKSAKCPECGKRPRNARDVIQSHILGSYYDVPHIPPTFIFTCSNPKCRNRNGDFEVKLKPIVLQVAKVRLVEW